MYLFISFFRLNDNVKNENGFIPGMNNTGGGGISSNVQSNRPQNMDIKLIHAKKQQARYCTSFFYP